MSGWLARLRGLSPTAVDVVLTVLALVAQSAPFLFTTRSDGRPWTVLEFAPVLLVALPVLWRRRNPLLCLLVTAIGIAGYSVVGGNGPEQPVWYGALVVLYTVADQASRRSRVAALVASAAGIVLVGGILGSVAAATREGFLWGAAYALGRSAQVRRDYAAALEERAARQERARIARDTHDILAHAVSVMVVQAEAGPVVLRSDPARAEAAFDAVAAAGRDAMTQLRRTLGVLKEGDGVHAGRRLEEPSLDRLPELVAGVGPHVSLVTGGARRAVPADVEVAVYRIVQEALTNVVRHSDADTASVRLDWAAAELVVTIADSGTPKPNTGGGHGLVGIRERASACGGTAHCGPVVDGSGFQVLVRLPV
ncbi:MAG: sensor histidine kinase [Actinophytocola sp.]|uniref:sensor histidine kinase n=1 Tax=Actinophytocola sp. TaxID=1872138 RepID=UPI00132C94C8|nr:histidine kinase [Actinophytocola sp.]MPZ83624.1 sensor histidine kinase [Actinophytocola sp.]